MACVKLVVYSAGHGSVIFGVFLYSTYAFKI